MHLLRKSISLFVALSALALSVAGTAAAATATVTPGGGVNGTGTTAWELTISGSSGSATFNCANAGFNANLRSATGALPLTIGTAYQQTFSNCRTGSVSYNFACTPTATLSATGLTSGAVTPLSLNTLTCTASIGGCGSATISGSLPETFTNAGSQLTVGLIGQRITSSGSTCSLIPNGTATFAAPGGVPFVYAVTPVTNINVV